MHEPRNEARKVPRLRRATTASQMTSATGAQRAEILAASANAQRTPETARRRWTLVLDHDRDGGELKEGRKGSQRMPSVVITPAAVASTAPTSPIAIGHGAPRRRATT